MNLSIDQEPNRADGFYQNFENPLIKEIRRQVYGEDIALHSWSTPQELRSDLARLNLSEASRIADLGCGPCGALTMTLDAVRCRGNGIDQSALALRIAQERAAGLSVAELMDVQLADLNEILPFADESFDAVQVIDAVPHLRDREAFFQEVARIIRPGGRFLCVDPYVLTGSISNRDLQVRLNWGYSQIAPSGWNEKLIVANGFELIDRQDRTDGARQIAESAADAYRQHKGALKERIPLLDVEQHIHYLETAARLTRDKSMARIMLLASKK